MIDAPPFRPAPSNLRVRIEHLATAPAPRRTLQLRSIAAPVAACGMLVAGVIGASTMAASQQMAPAGPPSSATSVDLRPLTAGEIAQARTDCRPALGDATAAEVAYAQRQAITGLPGSPEVNVVAFNDNGVVSMCWTGDEQGAHPKITFRTEDTAIRVPDNAGPWTEEVAAGHRFMDMGLFLTDSTVDHVEATVTANGQTTTLTSKARNGYLSLPAASEGPDDRMKVEWHFYDRDGHLVPVDLGRGHRGKDGLVEVIAVGQN